MWAPDDTAQLKHKKQTEVFTKNATANVFTWKKAAVRTALESTRTRPKSTEADFCLKLAHQNKNKHFRNKNLQTRTNSSRRWQYYHLVATRKVKSILKHCT